MRYRLEYVPDMITDYRTIGALIQEKLTEINDNQKIIEANLRLITNNFIKLKKALLIKSRTSQELPEDQISESLINIRMNLKNFISVMSQMLDIPSDLMLISSRNSIGSIKKTKTESVVSFTKLELHRISSFRPSIRENNIFSFNDIVGILQKKPSKDRKAKSQVAISNLHEQKEAKIFKKPPKIKNLEIIEENDEHIKKMDSLQTKKMSLMKEKGVRQKTKKSRIFNKDFLDSPNFLLSSTSRKERVFKLNGSQENEKKENQIRKSVKDERMGSFLCNDSAKKKQNYIFKKQPLE